MNIPPAFREAAERALQQILGKFEKTGLSLHEPIGHRYRDRVSQELIGGNAIHSVPGFEPKFPLVMTSSDWPMMDVDAPTPMDVHGLRGSLRGMLEARKRSLGEVLSGAEEWSRSGEDPRPLRVALTPGGYHIDDLSYGSSHPDRFFESAPENLRDVYDKTYKKLVFNRGAYARRVSPKLGRPEDFIAEPVAIFGNTEDMNDDRLISAGLHDAIVGRMRGSQAEEGFKNMVAYHLGRGDVKPQVAAHLRKIAALSALLGTRGILDRDAEQQQ